MKFCIRLTFILIGCLIILFAANCHKSSNSAKTTTKYDNIDLNLTHGAWGFVFVSSNNELFVNDEIMTLADLTKKLEELAKSKSQSEVICLKCEEGVGYGTIVSIFSVIRDSGINRVKLIVDGDKTPNLSKIVEIEIAPKLPPLAEIKNQYPVQLSSDALFVILKSGSGSEQEVTLNGSPMNLSELETTLKDVLAMRPQPQRAIEVRATTNRTYRDVLQVIKVIERTAAKPIRFQLEYLDDNIDKYLLRGRMGGA